ncbi:PAS domain-containing sensor histidine kinase [Solidesulfovibrio sp.]|uniref:PAS domain-containing sensor histidine kinase n=1 Tax=Solidesulfovibrio sp. TaxID=2910990 RepID=UPI00263552F6|nr:PAS domain-containing sensor histidine kinase [Solidesulfovibrio sp.]
MQQACQPLAPYFPDALAAAYAALPLGVILGDGAGDIVHVNSAFHAITEITARDLEFMAFDDVLSVFCLGFCATSLDIGCPHGRWLNVERAVARADGGNGWVRIHLSEVEVEGRRLRQLLVEDVTKYRDCIDALLNRKKKYQSILDKRPDPICCFLPDFSITYANVSCCRCFGRGRNECQGENMSLLLPPAVRDDFHRAVAAITPEQPVAEFEQRLDDAGGMGALEGRPMWVRWVIQGFFYKTGHVREYQAAGADISDQKMAESRVMHADRLLSLGGLVSEVAHEINNPNNFIMLNAPLLMDIWWRLAPVLERLPEEAVAEHFRESGLIMPEIINHGHQLIQGIVEGSTRISGIVKELKQYSRQEVDGGFELLGINEVVQAASALMQKKISKSTKRFSIRYGYNLPLVRGRRQRLEQVVVNLLQNACQALTHISQGIVLETRQDPARGCVTISVADEGVGIAAEALPLVTQPFYSTKGVDGGTGLGLSISLSVAREHGGRLEIESAPGRGTRAVVSLPVALAGPSLS